jgi:ketosteroid isomerase-like protein
MEETRSNRRLAQALISCMNKRDPLDLEKSLSKDAVLDFPGTSQIEGRKRIITFFKALFRKYPRLEFTIRDIIVEEDRACILWTNEGVKANGEDYKNSGITFVRMAEGKIDFISDYFKDTSFVSGEHLGNSDKKQRTF